MGTTPRHASLVGGPPPWRRFGPRSIGADRPRLVGAKIVRVDARDDEILRRHGTAGEPSQQRELSGVRHRVGKGSLKKTGRRGAVERVATLEVHGDVLHHRVKAANLAREIGLWLRPVAAADEKGPRIAEHARHVPDELRWGAAGAAGAEVAEV